jgi:hypothetical protein
VRAADLRRTGPFLVQIPSLYDRICAKNPPSPLGPPAGAGPARRRPYDGQPMPADTPRPTPSDRDDYAPSALPSTTARVLAFVSILLGGLCGGLIGWSLVDLTCESGDCGTAAGLAGLAGALVGAGGVAVVAVLALRAMGEWRVIQHRQAQSSSPTDADQR